MAMQEFELTERKPGWITLSEIGGIEKLHVPCANVDDNAAVEAALSASNLSHRWGSDGRLVVIPGRWTS